MKVRIFEHSSTAYVLQGWIEDLVLPDYKKVCEAQGRVYLQQCCIVHYDLYRVHVAEEFRTWLYSKYPFVHLGVVPGGCTGKGQVADIALNRPIKHALKQEFTKWSAGQIQEQITEIKANTPPGKKADLSSVKLDLRVGPLRNLTAVWAAKVHSQVKEMRETILRGYEIAGTDKIFDTEFQRRAMQEHERLFGGLDGKGLPSGAQQGAAFVPQEEQGEPANVEEDDEDIPLAEWAIRTREAEAAANARPNVAAGSSNRASNPLTRFVIWHPPTVDRHPDVFQAGTENEEEIPIASLLKSAQAAAAAQAVTDVSAD